MTESALKRCCAWLVAARSNAAILSPLREFWGTVVSDESKGGAPKKLSTKDILAAARAQAAAASGGAAPAESAAPPPAAAPAAKPAAGKKPTSTADILAAARAAASGSAGSSEPAAAKPAAAPKPKPAAAAGAKPKSTADILAAARAAAAGGAPAAAEAAPGAPSKAPAAKPQKAAAAAAEGGPKLSVEEMLAAVRPEAPAAPAAAAAPAAPAKPVRPTVAPPMPVKPQPAKTPAPDAGRRNVLTAILTAPFAAVASLFSNAFNTAWTTLAATTGVATLATARYMLPNVLTEPPSKFKIGPPADYDLGTVATKLVAQYGIWIVHTDQYKGKNLIYALASVCTHLGCTPSWLEGERKYKCPCHGSGFYITGINFEGPAPRPLERVGISLSSDGMLEVDKSLKFQEEMGQWNDPASFYEVVG
jgi:cytochrome b6-f complex iron-sulfur subunit